MGKDHTVTEEAIETEVKEIFQEFGIKASEQKKQEIAEKIKEKIGDTKESSGSSTKNPGKNSDLSSKQFDGKHQTTRQIEPDAWMSYNNEGGAGLVPYLSKSRAESNSNSITGEGPPAYDSNEWPQPLFSASTIKNWLEKRLEKKREGLEKMPEETEDSAAHTAFEARIAELEHLIYHLTEDQEVSEKP